MTTGQGVPASGAGPIADMLAADPPPRIRSVTSELLDRELATPRQHHTVEEVWVETPGQLGPGGHWEPVEP